MEGDLNPFDVLAHQFEGIMREIGDEMLARVQDRCSVDVERVGDHVIRSVPGEHPRRDTSFLYDSFATATTRGQNIVTTIGTDVIYAPRLQLLMSRPIFDAGAGEPALLDEYAPLVVQRVSAVVESPAQAV